MPNFSIPNAYEYCYFSRRTVFCTNL